MERAIDPYTTSLVVFDLAEVGCQPESPSVSVSVAVMAIGAFIASRAVLRLPVPRVFRLALSSFFLLWAALGAALAFSTYGQEDRCLFLQRMMREGGALTVTGPVTHFHPMPFEGHDDETFDVAGVGFAYSDYGPTPAYHRSASHGGLIREGLPVRITYVPNPVVRSNEIVRLEILDER